MGVASDEVVVLVEIGVDVFGLFQAELLHQFASIEVEMKVRRHISRLFIIDGFTNFYLGFSNIECAKVMDVAFLYTVDTSDIGTIS